jgi:hypothetical protein
MKYSVFAILAVTTMVFAAPRIGARAGYTTADDPFTGLSADGAIFGGQLTFPILPILNIEMSGTYTSTQSDFSMESYLTNYIEEEYGVSYEGDVRRDFSTILKTNGDGVIPQQKRCLQTTMQPITTSGLQEF